MCNYEKYEMRREREKKEKRNEEINAELLRALRSNTREESLRNLFCALTFVVGTANIVCVEREKSLAL
jgi:hypothetical protein